MSAVGHAECEDAYGHSRAAGLASLYVLCMVGATWHDGVDVDAIEVFVTAPLDGPEKTGLFGFINLGSRV